MRPRWFVRGDLDGFFGLFIDNLLQLMLILVLCQQVAGLSSDFITRRILPGAAVSILIGNLFYAWQARQRMRQTGREDVTALPYGINTPSLIAYIVLIMGPIYRETGNATLAWQAGLFACLGSGVIETLGALVGDWLRRHTPRAALLAALAGVAITFIAVGFIFQIFASPVIALLPMLLILFTYAGRLKLPLGLPGGLLAVLTGAALAWGSWAVYLLGWLETPSFEPFKQAYTLALYPPVPVPHDLFALLTSETGWRYLAVIFPMGLFNVIGSLQNLESAEAAGDRYETRPSLLVNGIGTLGAALFGSPFPTTIYIGHPGWKAMGARAGYSILNGAVITVICLIGAVTLVLNVIPLEVALGILLWIGIIITAQAFQAVPTSHALAVALGLVPALAAWALVLLDDSLRVAGASLLQAASTLTERGVYVHGIIALSQGFLLSSMILAAMLVFVIERRFLRAAAWTAAAAVLSFVGLIHAYELTPEGVQNRFLLIELDPAFAIRVPPSPAPEFTLMYGLGAVLLVVLHFITPDGEIPSLEEQGKAERQRL